MLSVPQRATAGMFRRPSPATARPLKYASYKRDSIHLSPTSGVDDPLLKFVYHTTKPQIIRFARSPVLVSYLTRQTDPIEVRDDPLWLNTQSRTQFVAGKGRASYFQPAIGGYAFFQEAHAVIDNFSLRTLFPSETQFMPYYAYLQRIFCTNAERMYRWGVRRIVPDEAFETDVTNTAMLEILEGMEFGEDNSLIDYRTTATDLDCSLFLSQNRNYQLVKILGIDEEERYFVLGPDRKMAFYLRKQDNPSSLMEHLLNAGTDTTAKTRPKLDDDGVAMTTQAGAPITERYSVYNPVTHNPAMLHGSARKSPAMPVPSYQLKFQEVTLEIETMTPDLTEASHRELLKRTQHDSWTRKYDIPRFVTSEIPKGSRSRSIEYSIDKGVGLAYFFFALNLNINNASDKNRYRTSQCVWPKHLYNITFYVGNEEAWFSGGLTTPDAKGSADRLRFYDYLKQRGWYDYDNPEYFPQEGDKLGYRCAIPLDFTMFDMSEGAHLRVKLTYHEGMSQDGSMAMLCKVCTESVSLDFSRGGEPTWELSSIATENTGKAKAPATASKRSAVGKSSSATSKKSKPAAAA